MRSLFPAPPFVPTFRPVSSLLPRRRPLPPSPSRSGNAVARIARRLAVSLRSSPAGPAVRRMLGSVRSRRALISSVRSWRRCGPPVRRFRRFLLAILSRSPRRRPWGGWLVSLRLATSASRPLLLPCRLARLLAALPVPPRRPLSRFVLPLRVTILRRLQLLTAFVADLFCRRLSVVGGLWPYPLVPLVPRPLSPLLVVSGEAKVGPDSGYAFRSFSCAPIGLTGQRLTVIAVITAFP